MTVFENGVSVDVIKLRSCGTGVGPKSSDWCPYKKRKRDTDTEGRMPWKTNTGRMLCDDGDGLMCTQTKK